MSAWIAALFIFIFARVPLFASAPHRDVGRKAANPKVQMSGTDARESEKGTHCPTRFVTAIVPDGHGGVWVSGEDFGIYHGVPAGSNRPDAIGVKAAAAAAALAKKQPGLPRFHWHHFDASNSPGLASNFITALCVDGQGRLWAGTNRHGVSVFNGKKWKHYNIVTGPLGSHVYALAYNAIANQVWIATENGLSIYQCGKSLPSQNSRLPSVLRYAPHTWRYITAMDGLPPNPDCIAFDSHGRAFVGTQCNGLAIGTPAMALPAGTLPGQPFAKRKLIWRWRVVTGPEHISQLRTAYGYGLPGNLINCILVTPANHVYVGTDWGLAYSTNDGESFRYERGQDYAAKIMGLWHPPQGYRPPPQEMLNGLLPGDHITCLAQDLTGNIWIGTWRNGYEVLNPETGKEFKSEDSPALAKADGYISQICPITEISIPTPKSSQPGLQSTNRRSGMKIPIQLDQAMLVGRYGFGVHEFGDATERTGHISRVAWRNFHRRPAAASLPQNAKPPSERHFSSLLAKLALGTKQAGEIHYPFAAGLRDDWVTQGDWTARYGREYAVLCAAHFDLSFRASSRDHACDVDAVCGPHHRLPFESMREWEQLADTDNPKSLYIPELGYRRQTNWDDHGETYSTNFQGPDLWARVLLQKSGIYRLSLYFFNKDGHAAKNRQRDWVVEVYPLAAAYRKTMVRPILSAMVFPKNPMALEWCRGAIASTPLAAARVVNFWNPVYTRFAIAGPGQYMVRIARGSSVNTEICGIFIDKVDAPHTQFDDGAMPCMWGVNYRAPEAPVDHPPNQAVAAAMSAWRKAAHAFGAAGFTLRQPAMLLAYRAAADNHASPSLLARWRWRLGLWTQHDRKAFANNMNKAFASMLRQWKGLKQFMIKNHTLQPNSGELGNE